MIRIVGRKIDLLVALRTVEKSLQLDDLRQGPRSGLPFRVLLGPLKHKVCNVESPDFYLKLIPAGIS
jgi:hypothetical protein